jgi:beta-1,4-mannosyl-glycoprotein beta-1,4-N-acetylglucosaminyltransferase
MQAKDVKVIDTFPYNGEPILELRLQLLYDVVDEFVLVEARETHSGIRKEELYVDKHAAVIAPYKHKVTMIIIDSFAQAPAAWKMQHAQVEYITAGGLENWYREQTQRDASTAYIREQCKHQKCIVLACDVDELVRPETVASLKLVYHDLSEPVKLSMQHFSYNFQWKLSEPWSAAFVINDVGLQTATLNNGRSLVGIPYFPDTGWHASHFFNTAGLVRKLQSFAHQELNTDRYTNEAHVRRSIRTGTDLSNRDTHKLSEYDVSELPLLLQQFQAKLLFLQEYA